MVSSLPRSPLNYPIGSIPGVTCADRSNGTFARMLAIITFAQERYVAKQSGYCSRCILHKVPAAFRPVCLPAFMTTAALATKDWARKSEGSETAEGAG